jgi:hypothetical protein
MGNVLIDYYVYREYEISLFGRVAVLEDVFEGGLEGMGDGIDLGIGLLLRAPKLGGSSNFRSLSLEGSWRYCYARSSLQHRIIPTAL